MAYSPFTPSGRSHEVTADPSEESVLGLPVCLGTPGHNHSQTTRNGGAWWISKVSDGVWAVSMNLYKFFKPVRKHVLGHRGFPLTWELNPRH